MNGLVLCLCCFVAPVQQTEAEREAVRLLAELNKPERQDDFTSEPARRRSRLFVELLRLGPEARIATPKLVEMAQNGERFAAAALVALRDDGFEAVRSLLHHDDAKVRDEVLSAVRHQECSAPFYDDILACVQRYPDSWYGYMALASCSENDDRTVRLLVDRLKKADLKKTHSLRTKSILDALKLMGPRARLAIRQLRLIATNSEAGTLQLLAAEALSAVDPSGQYSLPILLRLGKSKTMGGFGLTLVARHPSRHRVDIEGLIRAYGDTSDGRPPNKFLWGLVSECEGPEVMGHLLGEFEKFEHVNADHATRIAVGIIRREPRRDEIANFLIQQLENEDLPSRSAAAFGLGFVRTNQERVLAVLRQAMLDKTLDLDSNTEVPSDLAISAAWAIARLDAADTKCIDVLKLQPLAPSYASRWHDAAGDIVEVLGDRIELLRPRLLKDSLATSPVMLAQELLFSSGPAGVKALVEDAFRLLADPKRPSNYARQLLWNSPQRLGAAFDIISAQCESEHFISRWFAIRALGKLKTRPNESIPLLIQACLDERATVRAEAAEALGKFGEAARPALPQLETLSKDPYLTVSNAASRAISAIR